MIMAITDNQLKANPVIGVDMAHYAVMTLDPTPNDPGGGTPVYGTPVPLLNVKAVRISSADNTETFNYDNVPKFTVKSKGEKTVNFVRASFNNQEMQALLGLKADASGITIEGTESDPPDIALGFRRMLTDNKYEYVWYLKGKMSMNEENTDTREKNVSIQDRTMVGTFIARQCDGVYVIRVSTADEGVSPEVFTNWFSAATIAKLFNALEGAGGQTQGTQGIQSAGSPIAPAGMTLGTAEEKPKK
jgi:phi13 family phage major tail protein